MAVIVDRAELATDGLGLQTVGQVFAHLQKSGRLVVDVLIDGQQPDLSEMGALRRLLLAGHMVFVETADPRELVLGALAEVEAQLAEADRLRGEASDLILRNQNHKAMEKLSGCFSTWQHAQESVLKTAQLLRLDLERVHIEGAALTDMVGEFATQLRSIKGALESRDFVGLNDILTYEATQTSTRWRAAVGTIREMARAA